MKILKKVSIIYLLLLILFISKSFAKTGTVNISSVRMREEANIDSKIITNLYKDDEVEILDEADGWYKVKNDGKTGYVKSDYLKVKENVKKDNTAPKESNVVEGKKINVRNNPCFMSYIVGTISAGNNITTQTQINNWVKVTDGKISGWVLKNSLENEATEKKTDAENKPEISKEVTENKPETSEKEVKEEKQDTSNNGKIAIVNVKTARVRKEASSSAEIVDLLDYNDEVEIKSKTDDWYEISYNGKSGYISASLVVLKTEKSISSRKLTESRTKEVTDKVEDKEETIPTNEEPTENKTTIEEPAKKQEETSAIINSPVSSSAVAVVEFAKQFLGYPYVYAGKKPETGFDCSGFTKYVFSNFGKELGASASSQASAGTEVARENLCSGDILLFYDDAKTKIGHVGIYISDGNFIHAANPKRGVVIDNINTSTYYNPRYVTARRIVE